MGARARSGSSVTAVQDRAQVGPAPGHGADIAPTLRAERPDDGNRRPPDRLHPHPARAGPAQGHGDPGRLGARVRARRRPQGVLPPRAVVPKRIGVLEVPPQRGVTRPAWNCHQFHATTDSTPTWALTVPRSMVVAATGVRTGRSDIRTAPPIASTRTTSSTSPGPRGTSRWRTPSRSEGLPEVALTALVPADARAEQALAATGPPSSTAAGTGCVPPLPPPHLGSAPRSRAGMEYPTFFTVFSRTQAVRCPGTRWSGRWQSARRPTAGGRGCLATERGGLSSAGK